MFLVCLFTFAKTADLLGNRRSGVSVSRSSGRSSDLITVFFVVRGFHAANLAKRALTSKGLVSGGGGRRQSQILVVDTWNILPGLGSKLVNVGQCLLAGSAGLGGHQRQVILIKDI